MPIHPSLPSPARIPPWCLMALCLTAGACGRGEPPPACDERGDIATVCGFRSPEDIEPAPEAGLLLVSQMALFGGGGSIAAFDPTSDAPSRGPRWIWPTGRREDFAAEPRFGDPECAPPDPQVFSPHGLTMHRGSQVAVVNHGGRETVELLLLEGRGSEARLSWQGCIELPAGTAGNDVVVAPSGEILVTNYLPSLLSVWGTIRVLLGLETGDVLSWRRDRGWQRVSESQGSGPNGIAVSPDGAWLFFSETGSASVVRLRREDGTRDTVEIGGAPDNLSWSPDGKLLAASHDSLFSLFTSCASPSHCGGPWTLHEIDPETLASRRLLHHDGSRIGTVASATQVGEDVWLGAVLSDRIGRWRHPVAASALAQPD